MRDYDEDDMRYFESICVKTEIKNKKGYEKGTRLYNIWCNMKQRCNNPNNPGYKHYGAKGIGICEEWEKDYKVFKKWALENGYNDNLEIDRIDSWFDYEPKNCRWVNEIEQANNTSRNNFIEFNGKKQTIGQWARELNMNPSTLWSRLYGSKWSIEKALTTEVKGA